MCLDDKVPLVGQEDDGVVRVAEPRRTFGDDLQDWLYVGRRSGDDPEDRTCRGLLLQRFRSSRLRAWTSSNSLTFSMAITAWSAKVSTSSICFPVNGFTPVRVSTKTPTDSPSLRSGTPRVVDFGCPAVRLPTAICGANVPSRPFAGMSAFGIRLWSPDDRHAAQSRHPLSSVFDLSWTSVRAGRAPQTDHDMIAKAS